jgi:hypothetical protein
MMIGQFVPTCGLTGDYSAIQCHGSIGYCWCAERNGAEIPGTRIRGSPVCDRRKFSFVLSIYLKRKFGFLIGSWNLVQQILSTLKYFIDP